MEKTEVTEAQRLGDLREAMWELQDALASVKTAQDQALRSAQTALDAFMRYEFGDVASVA